MIWISSRSKSRKPTRSDGGIVTVTKPLDEERKLRMEVFSVTVLFHHVKVCSLYQFSTTMLVGIPGKTHILHIIARHIIAWIFSKQNNRSVCGAIMRAVVQTDRSQLLFYIAFVLTQYLSIHHRRQIGGFDVERCPFCLLYRQISMLFYEQQFICLIYCQYMAAIKRYMRVKRPVNCPVSIATLLSLISSWRSSYSLAASI